MKEFLKKNKAWEKLYDFAKDLTLEEFVEKCQRVDWFLWLFRRVNPGSLRELTLAKGKCAETQRMHMDEEESLDAVGMAIAFGEGKATEEELRKAAQFADWAYESAYANYEDNSYLAATRLQAARDAYLAAADIDIVERFLEDDTESTSDICRKYLPIEIWNRDEV